MKFVKLKQLKNRLLKYYVERFIFKVRKDEWCFAPIYGIGDTYLILSLLTAFKQQNGGGKIRLILTQPSHTALLKLFPDVVNIMILVDLDWLRIIPVKTALSKGTTIIFSCLCFFRNAMVSLLGYKNMTINEVYKIMLNIAVTTPNAKPVIPSEVSEAGTKRFDSYGLPKQNTVLLAPHANTVNEQSLPLVFWTDLIRFLLDNQYQVAILSNDTVYQISDEVKPVFFPLDEAIPFCEQCGYLVSIRSGLCDLVSTADCEKIVLYPKNQPNSRNIAQWSSIVNMGIAGEKVYEYNYDAQHIEELTLVVKNKLKR